MRRTNTILFHTAIALSLALWALGCAHAQSVVTLWPENLTASAAGTTAATVATLTATTGKRTFLCGFSVDAQATAAAAGTMTVTGIIGGTMTFGQTVGITGATVNSGFAHNIWNFSPCLLSAAISTNIVVTSAAAGNGGTTEVNAWGGQQ